MLILVYLSILQCYICCSGLPMLLEEHYSCSPGVYFCWQFITMTEQLKCLLYCAFCLFLFVGRSGRWRCVTHTDPADNCCLETRCLVFRNDKWHQAGCCCLWKTEFLNSLVDHCYCQAGETLLWSNYIPALLYILWWIRSRCWHHKNM